MVAGQLHDVLFGRDGDLDELSRHLEGGRRSTTLVGPAGVGKTALAARLLRAQRPALAANGVRVATVDCSSAPTWEDVCHGLSRALGIGRTVPVADAWKTQLALGLSSAPTWLLLDNLEDHAEVAAEAIESWLEAAPELQVIATSRVVLGIAGEQVFEVAPLPPPTSPDELDGSAAAQLFLARARARVPDFALGSAEREVLVRLLRALDGLPLALELAAGRMAVLSLAQLLDRIDQRFQLLRRSGPRARHASLEAALGSSFDALGAVERASLVQCSVFAGSFDLAAFEAVVAMASDSSAVDVLQSLRDKSFVAADVLADGAASTRRLRLLLSIRDLAAERAGDYAETAGLVGRYVAHYGALARSVVGWLEANDTRRGIATVRAEHENLTAALHAATASSPRDAIAIALALLRVGRLRGDFVGVVNEARRLLPLAPEGTLERHQLDCELLISEMFLVSPSQSLARAEALCASTAGVPEASRPWAFATRARTTALTSLGRSGEARAVLLAALEESADMPRLAAGFRQELIDQGRTAGAHDEARRHGEIALAALRTDPDDHTELNVLVSLALLHVDAGELELAKRRVEAGLRRAAEAGVEGPVEMMLHLAKARVCHLQGEYALVSELYRAIEDRAFGQGLAPIAGLVGAYAGVALCEQGRWLDGAERLRASLALVGRIEPIYGACLHAMLGLAEARLGHAGEARAMLERGDDLLGKLEVGSFRETIHVCRRAIEALVAESPAADTARLTEASSTSSPWKLFELELARRLAKSPSGNDGDTAARHLVVAEDGRWFEPPRGSRVKCGQRPVMRRMLVALARARVETPGASLGPDELLATGWPGERILPDAARRRLQVMVLRMRDLGLRPVLQTTDDGYRIDPECALRIIPVLGLGTLEQVPFRSPAE